MSFLLKAGKQFNNSPLTTTNTALESNIQIINNKQQQQQQQFRYKSQQMPQRTETQKYNAIYTLFTLEKPTNKSAGSKTTSVDNTRDDEKVIKTWHCTTTRLGNVWHWRLYDITKFIPNHPGSDKIMLGGWLVHRSFLRTIYQQHN
ncbi:hypothetical protein CVS40_5331 [Lucilia cuprina]|nr:hypothetical protein CVS40_5331 [Lucilia cuprina]